MKNCDNIAPSSAHRSTITHAQQEVCGEQFLLIQHPGCSGQREERRDIEWLTEGDRI